VSTSKGILPTITKMLCQRKSTPECSAEQLTTTKTQKVRKTRRSKLEEIRRSVTSKNDKHLCHSCQSLEILSLFCSLHKLNHPQSQVFSIETREVSTVFLGNLRQKSFFLYLEFPLFWQMDVFFSHR
jgi:hypothetical protein